MTAIAEAPKSTSAAWLCIRDVGLNGTHLNMSYCANIGLLKIIKVKLPMGFNLGKDSKIHGI